MFHILVIILFRVRRLAAMRKHYSEKDSANNNTNNILE